MNRVTSSWWYIRDGVVHRRYRFVDVPCVCTREFGALSGAARAPTTLTLTRQSLCTRLHVDAVRLRLLTTYFGAGTEWVAWPLASRLVSEATRGGGNALGDALKVCCGVCVCVCVLRERERERERERKEGEGRGRGGGGDAGCAGVHTELDKRACFAAR